MRDAHAGLSSVRTKIAAQQSLTPAFIENMFYNKEGTELVNGA